MPEGHSIHRLANALGASFNGKTVRASSPQGRFYAGAKLIDKQKILTPQAWGKHLFIPIVPPDFSEHNIQLGDDNASWIHVHLGLYGSWTFNGNETFGLHHSIGAPRNKNPIDWKRTKPRDTVRLRLETHNGVADLVGPNQCELQTGAEMRNILKRLGPDPLRNYDGDKEKFIKTVRTRKSTIGTLVMNQSVVAGAGNIYRAECLFRTGINPHRLGINVSEKRLACLWDDLVSAMNDGVRDGKIITVPPALALIENDFDPEGAQWSVYHRTSRPCLRCDHPISETNMQGRRLFWCASCQK